MTANERDSITQLVRTLGSARGALRPTPREIAELRDFYGRQVLGVQVDSYILGKFHQHVETDGHWPEDTTPEEYLESLRETVLDARGSIYLTDAGPRGEWTIYFVGRVRRPWRGPEGSDRIVVLFNAERHFLITGFQPSRDDAYVERQGGFWLKSS